MKRSLWTLSILLVIGLFGFSKISSAKVYARPIQEPAVGNPIDQSSQEYERTKELLEIWKDHVRTITKERDEAYKEIEALKNQGATASAPAAQDAMGASEKEDALRQMDFLKDKMSLLQKKYEDLQSENQNLQSSASRNEADRVNGAQLAALQAKAAKLKVVEKELQEARSYFSSYMKDLDTKNKKMLDENEALRSELQNTAAGKQKQEDLEKELTQLRSENERLQKIQTQQSKTIQTLKSTIRSSLDSLDADGSEQKK